MDPKFTIQSFLLLLSLILNADLLCRADTEPSGPVIKIQGGSIKGAQETSRNGRPFYQFLGIPYGHVPERFMESELAKPWEGVKDATEFGSACIQVGQGEEDCLFVNVFTPFLPEGSKEKLPVLFFIHGGAFFLGSANLYGATYFMDEDVVLVTINYRLGAFGFLNLGIDKAPGNQGLKDQVLALKWVQENIHHFNGDKSRVTVYGESAGAASVSLLILTPLSKGLFHYAISQSGTALCAWTTNPKGEEHALLLAKKLKCSGTKEEILACLLKVEGMDVIKALPTDLVPKNLGEETSDLKAMSFIPTVEVRAPSDKSTIYISKPPMDIMNEGSFQNVPWIVGTNADEGRLFIKNLKLKGGHPVEEIKSIWMKMGPSALNYKNRADKDDVSEKVRQFYFGDRTEVMDNVSTAASDRMFNYCSRSAADAHAKKNPVYLYFLEKSGGFSLMSYLSGGVQPAVPTHADELTYQWNFISPFIPEEDATIGPQHKFYGFSRDFVKMWAHFAKTGKPMNEWNSKPIAWDPKTSGDHKWFHLDDDAKMMEEDPAMHARMKFWADLNL